MITIRPTSGSDVNILFEIQKAAFLPLYEKYRDAGNPALRGVEDIENRLDNENFKYFTILRDGEIVGGIFYKIHGRGPFFDSLGEGEYYLQRVYIKPELHGQRIAQTAIKLCEAEFTDAKYFTVDFPVDMEKNRRCYEAAGYSDTGKRLEAEPGLVLACYERLV